MFNLFQQTYVLAGLLTADVTIRHTAVIPCTLLHVSVTAANNSDATLTLGTSTDADALLAEAAVGDLGAPAVYEQADFPEGQYPHVEAGEVLVYTLDHDGDEGTAASGVTLVLTFAAG